jgi:hypothetical protein
MVETLQNFDFLAKVVHFFVCFPSKNQPAKHLPFGDELKSDDLTAALATAFVNLPEGAFSNRM